MLDIEKNKFYSIKDLPRYIFNEYKMLLQTKYYYRTSNYRLLINFTNENDS